MSRLLRTWAGSREGETMTTQQARALAHHCRFAFETMHNRFGSLAATGRHTVMVTVNSGYE
jgi:hypothetical protein